MPKGSLNAELGIIVVQLDALDQSINDSTNHTEELNFSYPNAARRYNVILDQLKEFTEKNLFLKVAIDGFSKFEEKDFLPSGNYNYAVRLQQDVKILRATLFQIGISEVTNKEGVQKPIVFISYATEELALADFIKAVLNRWTEKKIEVFIAKRDLKSGDDPLGIMEGKLKTAYSIIPICSKKAKNNPWVWWESAAVWGTGHRVHPLFTNISPDEFGTPLTLFTQGKEYFLKDEFVDTLKTVCNQLQVNVDSADLNSEELNEYKKLSEEYIKEETSAKVEISYNKISMTQDFHKYSLILDVINRTDKKFDNVVLELYFPIDYIEKKEWNYPYLNSSVSEDKPGYLCLTFNFSGLTEHAKKLFSKYLLPGKRLRIFGEGEGGMTSLHYEMDNKRWEARFKYEAHWKVYINGGAPQEGSISLDSIQFFKWALLGHRLQHKL